jgi:hypothetical protein
MIRLVDEPAYRLLNIRHFSGSFHLMLFWITSNITSFLSFSIHGYLGSSGTKRDLGSPCRSSAQSLPSSAHLLRVQDAGPHWRQSGGLGCRQWDFPHTPPGRQCIGIADAGNLCLRFRRSTKRGDSNA